MCSECSSFGALRALLRSNFLIAAIAAFLSLLGATSSQAAHIDPRGLGEVLLFPYYSTTGKYDTYINLVNTREEAKALKVRFRESMNGTVVLEFNLYLAPRDHWSAVIYPNTDGPDVQLRTADRSCTVPLSIYEGEAVSLSNENYQSDSENGLERTQEGFVEVIEMAVIGQGSMEWADAIAHRPSGNAYNCSVVDIGWNAGIWRQHPTDGASNPTGGLYGYGVLIDVEEGTEAAYDAVAIANFSAGQASPLHTSPTSTLPTLASGDTQYQRLVDGNLISGTANSGIDAVSALLMQATLRNDYVLEPSIGASTDWVITFPTKHEYVNQETAKAPFTSAWDAQETSACEAFLFVYFDREEGTPPDGPYSPFPGQSPPASRATELCAQANVFSLNGGTSASGVLKADFERNASVFVLDDDYENGWARMDFDLVLRPPLTAGSVAFRGLPYIGFALQKYVNGSVVIQGNTVLSNYVGVVGHKGEVVLDNP